ncbi:MAG: SCO family protein [bacterium]
MRKIGVTLLVLVFYAVVLQSVIPAQDKHIEVGIDEKLGDVLPQGLEFKNSDGSAVLLSELINKPTILALVYYECPGICNPMLSELAWTAEKIELAPGEDFQIISLSFDHNETPEVAAKWKKNYFDGMKGKYPEKDWYFLTGDSITIKKLTDAVGFYFKPDGQDFRHASTLITISPGGKVCRYIFGTTFNPFDMKMALLEAEAGKSSPTISKVLQFCFSYDSNARNYTLNVTRIIGTIMLLCVGIFLGVLTLKKKKNKKSEGVVVDGK